MYQVERHGSDYAVYNDAGTIATCGNADDARKIKRALSREAVIGDVREVLIEAGVFGAMSLNGADLMSRARQTLAALDRAEDA